MDWVIGIYWDASYWDLTSSWVWSLEAINPRLSPTYLMPITKKEGRSYWYNLVRIPTLKPPALLLIGFWCSLSLFPISYFTGAICKERQYQTTYKMAPAKKAVSSRRRRGHQYSLPARDGCRCWKWLEGNHWALDEWLGLFSWRMIVDSLRVELIWRLRMYPSLHSLSD